MSENLPIMGSHEYFEANQKLALAIGVIIDNWQHHPNVSKITLIKHKDDVWGQLFFKNSALNLQYDYTPYLDPKITHTPKFRMFLSGGPQFSDKLKSGEMSEFLAELVGILKDTDVISLHTRIAKNEENFDVFQTSRPDDLLAFSRCALEVIEVRDGTPIINSSKLNAFLRKDAPKVAKLLRGFLVRKQTEWNDKPVIGSADVKTFAP